MNNKTSYDNIAKMWKLTTYKSDIYKEYNNFIQDVENKNIYEKKKYIKNQIKKNCLQKNLEKILMYLNEYEIYFDVDDLFYRKIESYIEKIYNLKLLNEKRSNCKFFDKNIKNDCDVKKLKNKHKNKRCFIIGNGPSLNKLDLTKLKNEITFGVNSIFLNYEKMGFQTTYYSVEDYHVLRERGYEISQINSVKFIPQYGKKYIPQTTNDIYINIIPDYRRYLAFPLFSTDISRRVWVGGTVTYINLQIAFYMGFSKIYMIGFDHNYIIPSSALIDGANIKSTENDPNHFHPEYFGKGFSWHIPLVERMELCYLKALHTFKVNNIKIYNASVGGKLDIFERIDYNTLFNNL